MVVMPVRRTASVWKTPPCHVEWAGHPVGRSGVSYIGSKVRFGDIIVSHFLTVSTRKPTLNCRMSPCLAVAATVTTFSTWIHCSSPVAAGSLRRLWLLIDWSWREGQFVQCYRVLSHSTWLGTTSMPSNYAAWHCKEGTSLNGSRSMALCISPMPCVFGHKSMVNSFTHGFASHKGFPPPMILKDNKFLYNYGPSSRRPSVYLQWTAQCIIFGVPFSCQFHLANINRCWTMPILAPESLTH